MINDDMNCGETVAAILRDAKTGAKRVISKAKYKVEIKITDLTTGAVHTFEETR